MQNYTGDVEVTVKMRYRLDADFSKLNKDGKPTLKQVLEMLQSREYNDILDEEELEVLSVETVSENYGDDEDEE